MGFETPLIPPHTHQEANSQLVMMHQKISDLETSLADSKEELSTVQGELDKTRAMVKCQEHIAQEVQLVTYDRGTMYARL